MQPLILSKEFPPNIEEIRKAFNLGGDEVFCYGRTIHNPTGKPLTEDIIEHEYVHFMQQESRVKEWWSLYLKDPLFRSSQEIPAHQKQFQVAKRIIKDKNQLFKYLNQLAINLSSETYGKCLTYSEALKAIQEKELFDVKNLISK